MSSAAEPLEPASTRARAWRIGRTARRLADAWPLTALGMALAAVSAVALWGFGFAKLDLVLLVLGYGGAGLLLISVLVVLATALVLSIRLRRMEPRWSAARFETGAASRTGFSVASLWWLPLAQVHWTWKEPAAEVEASPSGGRLRERVVLANRGVFEAVTRRIVVQDAFGLSRVAFHLEQRGRIEVLPHLGGIRRLPVLTSLTGGEELPHPMGLEDGDRVELRRYVPGDSARFIHWKVFGRTRKLMVRVPERALSRARRTVAFLVAGPSDEAAAAAARAAIEEEALGSDWQFGADGSPGATGDRSEAIQKVLRSSAFSGRSGSGLKRFLSEVDAGGPSALVVFAPPVMGDWLDQMRALALRRYGRVRVVLAVDAIHNSVEQPRWRRWLFRPAVRSGVERSELERVGRALGQLRCEVVIIDRVSGRVLGDAMHLAPARRRAA